MCRHFLRDESGAGTGFGLFITFTAFVMGGLALDVSNAISARTQLQVAADAAAHAALYTRDKHSEAEAREAALAVGDMNMRSAIYGQILADQNIEFGTWNQATHSFTPQPGARSAVRVVTQRRVDNGNGVRTFLLRLVGHDAWSIATPSVFITYQPACLREGFVAEGRIDIQSNNTFRSGFCLHSNSHVSLNQNNQFEPGTIVSMPDLAALDMPASGYEKNEGLELALRAGTMDIRILRELDTIIAGLKGGDRDYLPDYITSTIPIEITHTKNQALDLAAADLLPGRVYSITCTSNNGNIKLPGGTDLSDMVIVTNCPLQLGQNANLRNMVLATTNTDATSISGAADAIFGDEANCGSGGAKILTKGGMRFASRLTMHGSQLIAAGSVQFAAQGAGIKGASVIAGDMIDGTSNMDMGLCGAFDGDGFYASYFRLAA
jgi:Flp pilus assembly protein TadG